jgi:DNA (cytosine-5)-methyltransferase 1
MSYTFIDDYAGAGGSSQGLREAGLELVQAANHSARAIETHATNFPHADHLQTDLLIYNMRKRPRADVYWASPECTWHSPAGGRKRKRQMLDMFDEYVPDEAGERSRLTMMQVVAFAEAKRPKIVMVENVIEVADWELFESWLHSMTALGYEHQIMSVSAAHIWSETNDPAPQWRDRVYFVFYQRGIPFPDIQPRPLAFCPDCGEDVRARQSWKRADRRRIGKYRKQYTYVCPSDGHPARDVEPWVLPAIAAIDTTDIGTTIGSRSRPIAESTLRRAWVGRQQLQQREMVVAAAGQTYDSATHRHRRFGDPTAYVRAQGVDSPLFARTGTPGDAYVIATHHGGGDPRALDPRAVPLPTRSTKLGEAFVTVLRNNSGPIDVSGDPLQTIAAGGNHHALTLVEPFVTRHYSQRGGEGSLSRRLDEPLGSITGTGGNHSLVVPYRKGMVAKSAQLEPLPTATTVDWAALAHGSAEGEPIPPVEKLRELMADWYFRMLQWREHANAQRFPRDYIFTGNQGENTLMAGNAVASNVAHYLGLLAIMALDGLRVDQFEDVAA